jgi:hypothetical protein
LARLAWDAIAMALLIPAAAVANELEDRTSMNARVLAAFIWPVSDPCYVAGPTPSNLGLLSHFQRIVNLNPQVPDRTFKFGMIQ